MFKETDCKMEARAGIAIALLLVGCTQPQVLESDSEPIVAVSPTVAPRPARQQRNTPRRLKVRLTLDRPEDLKVKVGDSVVKGQVISDRSSSQANLIQEWEALRRQLKQLQSQSVTSSHAVEQAEVEQAQLKVEQARDAIANFHADSPWTDYARQVLPLSENTQLGALKAAYQKAKGELAIAVAKLQKAKQEERIYKDPSTRKAELLGKLQEIGARLAALGVQAPYDGLVKSIKWLGQDNREIRVEITLSLKSVTASVNLEPN